MTAPVIPIDTPLMRWRQLAEAVQRAQQDPSPEALQRVDEAKRAYIEAYDRRAG